PVDVVGPGLQDEHFRLHTIELAIPKTPEHVLRAVAAPREVGGVPSREAIAPLGEEVRIVGGAPAPRDRIADEVHVDLALLRLGEQLLVRDSRILIATLDGTVPRDRPPVDRA